MHDGSVELHNAPRGIGLRGEFVWPKPTWFCNYIHVLRLSSCYPVVLACNCARCMEGREEGEGSSSCNKSHLCRLVRPIPSKKKLQLPLGFVTMKKNKKDPMTNGGQEEEQEEEEDQKHHCPRFKKPMAQTQLQHSC